MNGSKGKCHEQTYQEVEIKLPPCITHYPIEHNISKFDCLEMTCSYVVSEAVTVNMYHVTLSIQQFIPYIDSIIIDMFRMYPLYKNIQE